MEDTANLELPLMAPSQAQKHVTHNEALLLLDAIVQLSVLDKDLTAPPGGEQEGERWIVAAGATGDWAGQDGKVAVYQDGGWTFLAPGAGWLAWVADEASLYYWTGADWASVTSAITALHNLALLGIGTAADAANPFSAKLNKALWTARTAAEDGDGDLRYTMNKEGAANVVSLLLQSGWSGRAELGLVGDDDVSLKVSPDGAAWTTALVVDRTTGTLATVAGSAAAPALKLADADTGLYSAGADTIGFATAGVGQAVFDASGRWLIGSVTAYSTRTGSSGTSAVTPKSQILSTGAADASLMIARFGNNANGPFLFFAKSRGANVGDNAAVLSGDDLATFSFAGTASGGLQGEAARIRVQAAGAPTTDRTPGRIDFLTTDGAAVVAVRATIAETGDFQMGAARTTVIDASRHHRLRAYAVAALPSASPAGQMIYVSDGSSNRRLAVSDGTDWRFPDGAVVS